MYNQVAGNFVKGRALMSSVETLSEEGTAQNVLRSFTYTPRPESGRDCLVCATFAWEGACLDRKGDEPEGVD